MKYLILILVSFCSCIIGSICGIGGGVIIKPVLDASGIMSVNSISFLSGCTVLGMSIISVFKNLRQSPKKEFNIKIASLMAIGAVIGGLAGKLLYQILLESFADKNRIGAIQAIILLILNIGTLVYTLFKDSVRTLNATKFEVFIGFILGILSSFLGIGGGPINLVVLFYFFSMRTKQAALYSLYIIMFSQASSFISTVVKGDVPEFSLSYLVVMVACGIIGGSIGSRINRKINEKDVNRLFIGLITVIIFVCIFNIRKYI